MTEFDEGISGMLVTQGAGEGDSKCYDRDRFEDDGVVNEITNNPKTATVNITTIIPHAPPDALKSKSLTKKQDCFRGGLKCYQRPSCTENVAATL